MEADYFLKGEYTGYFAPEVRFFFTPVQSKEQASDLFYSYFSHSTDKERILQSYISVASIDYSELLPWVKDHIKYFIDGVLGDDCKAFSHANNCDFSSNLPYWAYSYYVSVKRIFKKIDDVKYHGNIDCFDFFLSTLTFCSNANHRNRVKFDVLYELVDEVLSDDSSSELQIAFATKFKDHKQQILEDWALNSHLDTE